MIRLSGVSSFQWSTSEQVYPLEKDEFGNTLYAQIVDLGPGHNSGSWNVNLPFLPLARKLFRCELWWEDVGHAYGGLKLPGSYIQSASAGFAVYDTFISLSMNQVVPWGTGLNIYGKFIYSK